MVTRRSLSSESFLQDRLQSPSYTPSPTGSAHLGMEGARQTLGHWKENRDDLHFQGSVHTHKKYFKSRSEQLWANFYLRMPTYGLLTSICLQLDTNAQQIHSAEMPAMENRIFEGVKIKLFISSLCQMWVDINNHSLVWSLSVNVMKINVRELSARMIIICLFEHT